MSYRRKCPCCQQKVINPFAIKESIECGYCHKNITMGDYIIVINILLFIVIFSFPHHNIYYIVLKLLISLDILGPALLSNFIAHKIFSLFVPLKEHKPYVSDLDEFLQQKQQQRSDSLNNSTPTSKTVMPNKLGH